MPIETTKYVTESGAVYFQTINSEKGKLINESWKRESKKPWDVKIDMAAYISPNMTESLQVEYDLVCKDDNEKDKRDDLEDMIVRGKVENYKELGGAIASLTSDNHVAFSKPVVSKEKIK